MVSEGVTLIASKKKRPEILNEVENMLFVWVNENQLMGDNINETSICEKARVVYDDLTCQAPGTSADEEG